MINLYDQDSIHREMAIVTRAMLILERRYRTIMRKVLNTQYAHAASLVEHGERDIEGAVLKGQDDRIKMAQKQYLDASSFFIKRTLGKVKAKKSPLEEALYFAARYAAIHAAANVTLVDNKTKSLIGTIISRGISDHKTFDEVAKDIVKTGKITNGMRAQTIAQTEIHSVSTFSTQEAVKTAGIVEKKKWFAVGDIRTRFSHDHMDGQDAIPLNAKYEVEVLTSKGARIGVDFMDHPGDPSASAANIVNCRCNQLFYTR